MVYDNEPIAFLAFGPPSLNSSLRKKLFGDLSAETINKYFISISRIVLDPRFRGAGIAADFVKACSYLQEKRFVEVITSLGRISKFLEKAGFRKIGQTKLFGKHSKMKNIKNILQSMVSVKYYYLLDKGKDFDKIYKKIKKEFSFLIKQ